MNEPQDPASANIKLLPAVLALIRYTKWSAIIASIVLCGLVFFLVTGRHDPIIRLSSDQRLIAFTATLLLTMSLLLCAWIYWLLIVETVRIINSVQVEGSTSELKSRVVSTYPASLIQTPETAISTSRVMFRLMHLCWFIGHGAAAFLVVMVSISSMVEPGEQKMSGETKTPTTTSVAVSGGASSSEATSGDDRIGLSVLLQFIETPTAETGNSSASRPTIHTSILAGLIQSLVAAGTLSKETADSLMTKLRDAAIDGGKEIVVDVAKKVIEKIFESEPKTPPSAASGPQTIPEIKINIAGCCSQCSTQAIKPKHHVTKKKPPEKCATPNNEKSD